MNSLALILLAALSAGAVGRQGPAPIQPDLFAPEFVSTTVARGMHADRRLTDSRRPAGVRQGTDPVRYTIRPVRTDSLLCLEITTRFRGEPDGRTRFALPSDRFGVQEMHR